MIHSRTVSKRGVSLVEVIVAISILSIASIAILSLIQVFNKNIRAVGEKLEIMELEKTLISLSVGKNICEKKITEAPLSFTFPIASFPPVGGFSIDGIFLFTTDTLGIAEKDKLLYSSSSIFVKSIEFKNITGFATTYFADMTIDFKGTTIPRKPVVTKVSLSGTIVGSDFVLGGCSVGSTNGFTDPTTIDNQADCLRIGGEWTKFGSSPGFCSFPNEGIDWY